MKAISLWQPWATLWLLSDPDEKVFETRHWYTGFRGPLLVHAAKKQDREIDDAIHRGDVMAAFERHGIRRLNFGAIIGQVDLVGCCRMDKMPAPSQRESAFGDWQSTRFAWERGPSPRMFSAPIPYKGSQGFFAVPASAIGGNQ